MLPYIARRLVQAVPVILLLTMISFGIMHLAPGGPGAFYSQDLSSPRTPEELARMRHLYGLDRPMPVQYISWLSNLAHGDFGSSYRNGEPVLAVLGRTGPATFLLMGCSMLLALAVSIPIGVLSAVRRYSVFDYLATSLAFFGISIPTFWIGLMAILVFGVVWPILPTTGIQNPTEPFSLTDRLRHLVMPVCIQALPLIGSWTRFIRSTMLEIMEEDYVRTARAKGLSERAVTYIHALRNALGPMVTLLGITVAYMVSSTAVVEYIFAWPGIGQKYIFAAIQDRDYPILLGTLVLVSLLTIIGSLLADIAYAIVDPRIKMGQGENAR